MRFSIHLLERALARRRESREKRRQECLVVALRALEELSREIPFEEAYLFGSLTKAGRFFEGSDLDVAFVGLRDEDFFRASAFLWRAMGTEVDILPLEDHPLKEKVLKEGIRWKRPG